MDTKTEEKKDDDVVMTDKELPKTKLTSQKDGLLVVIKALQLAQSRGAFTMEESSLIHQAVELFRGK